MPALPEVADARQPETTASARHGHGLVLQDRDPLTLERPLNPAAIEPPIVIAQDREDAEGRGEAGQSGGGFFGRNEAPTDDLVNDEITGQENEIRPCRLSEGDHSVQLVETVEGRADMEIRQHRDA